jgi:transcriptional regulator with XRE-family HTH domain
MSKKATKKDTEMKQFQWNEEKSRAAILLAEGLTQQSVADDIGKTRITIHRWLSNIEFSAEVDRLSLMTGIASKAERLRIAKRVITQKTDLGFISTEKDLLDWLKFAQSETDGIKLDLASLLAAVSENDSSSTD